MSVLAGDVQEASDTQSSTVRLGQYELLDLVHLTYASPPVPRPLPRPAPPVLSCHFSTVMAMFLLLVCCCSCISIGMYVASCIVREPCVHVCRCVCVCVCVGVSVCMRVCSVTERSESESERK